MFRADFEAAYGELVDEATEELGRPPGKIALRHIRSALSEYDDDAWEEGIEDLVSSGAFALSPAVGPNAPLAERRRAVEVGPTSHLWVSVAPRQRAEQIRRPSPEYSERQPEDPQNVLDRQRKYQSRREARDEVRVAVWVPRNKAQALRDIAALWRREAELADGVTGQPPPVQVPVIEVPPDLPPPGYTWLQCGKNETLMHRLLRANGGEWVSSRQAWRLRSDLVEPLGLQSRVLPEGLED